MTMTSFVFRSFYLLTSFTFSAMAFNLYPLIPTETMSQILGISSACVSALNKTLPCDNDLFQWTHKADQVYWSPNDIVTLCTTDCIAQTAKWRTSIESACKNDYLRSGERYVPADTLSGRFIEGLDMACMRSTSNKWCMIESYEWTGSDVLQVDCQVNPTDPWCLNPADFSAGNSRMSTLYDDDLLCSECFLKVLHARVTSDFLADTDFSDYLVNEFQDVQKVCQTSVGELVTRLVPDYPYVTDIDTTTPITTNPTPTPTACAGRTVDIRIDREEELDCHDIAEKYQIASGAVAVATKSDHCDSTGPICIAQACKLYRVFSNQTCASIAQSLSNTTYEVSVAQLATWNPNILGACDYLAIGQLICSGPPGGAWIKPPDSEIPDNSEGPIRGGPGSTPTFPIIDDPSSIPLDRVQEGIASDCTRYVNASSTSATCWKLANDAKISMPKLWELNPVLGKKGENCGTSVWLGYFYCVARKGDGDVPSVTSSIIVPSSTTGAAKPTNTQEGIDPRCNKFVIAKEGDGCWKIANDAGIELTQLYKWNSVLGANGENCGTQIFKDYYYCVGVSISISTSTTTPNPSTKQASTSSRSTTKSASTKSASTTLTAPLPTKTQAGFPPNCKKYVQAQAGDGCWAIANANNVSLEQFYALNPVLGSKGENCETQILKDYYYCLAT